MLKLKSFPELKQRLSVTLRRIRQRRRRKQKTPDRAALIAAEGLEDRMLLSANSNSILVAVGNVDADAFEEVFTAVNSYGNVQIFRSETGEDLGVPIYSSANNNEWTLQAIALGDVDNDGRDELFTAFERSDGGAYIYRSQDGFGIGGRIYRSATAGRFTVQAMAVGDMNGDGDAELFTAFERSDGGAHIYRSFSGNSIGSQIYNSATPGSFTIQALATGDVDGDGDDELYSAFHSGGGEARIYRSDTGDTIGSRIYTSASPNTFTVQALAAGDVDGDGNDELYSAFEHSSGEARIYKSHTGTGIGTRVYTSASPGIFTVNSLALGDVDNDGREEFFSSFDRSNGDALLYRSDTGNSIGSQLHAELFAAKHLFLNFNGGTTSPGFSGAPNSVTTPAFDFDGMAGRSFQDNTVIELIRTHVIEDFAPFRINITTVKPAYGTVYTVMIGGMSFRGTGESGVAAINGFNPFWPGQSRKPAYVFSQAISMIGGASPYAAKVGTTISHEAGHGFGLNHKNEQDAAGNPIDLDGDGVIELGNGDDAYANADSSFTPIMGNNLSTDRTIWTQDDVQYAPNRFLNGDDDVARLASKIGRRADDTTFRSFGALGVFTNHGRSGLIEDWQDTDGIHFEIAPGNAGDLIVDIRVEVPAIGANLDSTLKIVDSIGDHIVINAPDDDLGSFVRLVRPAAGSYSIVVGSEGKYTGDIGRYFVSVSSRQALPVPVTGELSLGSAPDDFTATVAADGSVRIFRNNQRAELATPIIQVPDQNWTVSHVAVGDVDGDGANEYYVGLQHVSGRCAIYRSDPGSGAGTRIWQRANMELVDLTIGDVDGDGNAELFTGLRLDDGRSALHRSDNGDSIGSAVWRRANWDLQSVAIGDLDRDGTAEIYTGMQYLNSTAALFRNEGQTGLGTRIWSSPTLQIESLTIMDGDDDGDDDLLTQLRRPNGTTFARLSDRGATIGSRLNEVPSLNQGAQHAAIEDDEIDGLFTTFGASGGLTGL